MTRPSRSRNWYDPGLSGMVPAGGRWTTRRVCLPAHRLSVVCHPSHEEQNGFSSAYCWRRSPWYCGHISAPRPTSPCWATRLSAPAVNRSVFCPLEPWAGRGGFQPMLRLQVPLPDGYAVAPPDELASRIAAAKATLGDRLLVLGHHYQRDEVMRWADARGDSFRLSELAGSRPDAEYVVFCGVHFMAESADILTGDHQAV